MSTIGGNTLPYVAGTRDVALPSLFSDGLLEYVAFLLNRLSAAVDKIIPRDESNMALSAFEMVPSDSRYNYDPFTRRLTHSPFRTPSLWLWWQPPSQRRRKTASYSASVRNYRMVYVYPELPSDVDVALRANIWQMINDQLHEGSDDQWFPGFSYNGVTSTVAQPRSLVSMVSDHDSIDWEFMGGQSVERIGAYDPDVSELGDKSSHRDFPAYVGLFTAELKMTIDLGKTVEAEDSTVAFNGPRGVPVMSGIVQHPDGAGN